MKNKFCVLKDPRLRQIRENFRKVIAFPVQEKITSLQRIVINNNKSDKGSLLEIKKKIKNLKSSLKKSTIVCPVCHYKGIERDIFYNSLLKEWYCTDCVRIIRDGYKAVLEKKSRGEWVDSGYPEEYASSFL